MTNFEQVPLEAIADLIEREKSSAIAKNQIKSAEEEPGRNQDLPSRAPVSTTIAALDIFKAETDGSVLWRASAASMDDAKRLIEHFAERSPGQYVILNQRTGEKLILIK